MSVQTQQMMMSFANNMMRLMMAKFMFNDVPHAAGILEDHVVLRTTVEAQIDALERAYVRYDSSTNPKILSARGIVGEVMGHHYSDLAVVVLEGEELVGVGVYMVYSDANLGIKVAHISELASFKTGIGTALVREIERIAAEEGCDQVILSHGPGSETFYYRLGYELETEYPGSASGTLMVKHLSPLPFDWTTSGYVPKITGFLFHNTATEKALKILKDGYIKPWAGSSSFTLDPCFNVEYRGITFIFPESVIRTKYGGKELKYIWVEDPVKQRELWEHEMEVAVTQLVYTSDCVEILPGEDCCRKYGFGMKYPYVDVRRRKAPMWMRFHEFAEVGGL